MFRKIEEKNVVFWCNECKTPIIAKEKEIHLCQNCSGVLKYLCADARPVFPEEKLLLSIMIDDSNLMDKNIWASNRGVFYIDGEATRISNAKYAKMNADDIRERLLSNQKYIRYQTFDEDMKKFMLANKDRLKLVSGESNQFICDMSKEYHGREKYISFSGGKDSTVVADLVKKALDDKNAMHIFGDTTLEMNSTYEYIDRLEKSGIALSTGKNSDNDFFELCQIIGVPSRSMRWCCTTYKTSPISRLIDELFGENPCLAFLGIRKSESSLRSKYERINQSKSSTKIQGQVTVSPIFYWKDIDVWLYILTNNLDFNSAYRSGYSRVGCFNCPNSTVRNELLTAIHMPAESGKWNASIADFARQIGKEDPEAYAKDGYWKARQGGRGVSASKHIKISHEACVTEDNSVIFTFSKSFDESFFNLLVPIGEVALNSGERLLQEVFVKEYKNGDLLFSATVFKPKDGKYTLKIRFFDDTQKRYLKRVIGYQVRKYNACNFCLKCETVCNFKAISVTNLGYVIDDKKCVRCGKCISSKYIEGGCLMYRFLFDSKNL